MLLKEMYKKLEDLGGFPVSIDNLNEEQEEFLENNNEYDIELEDLLDIINDYSCIDYAEINGIYRNVEEMAEEMIESCYDIPDTLLFYMDLEKLGNDMLDDDNYYELSNENIAYISL